jgi:hypothetical protein
MSPGPLALLVIRGAQSSLTSPLHKHSNWAVRSHV